MCLFHYGTVPLVLEALGTVIAGPALLFNIVLLIFLTLYTFYFLIFRFKIKIF